MTRITGGGIVLMLSLIASTAGAQVNRCGDGKTYTDKPCDGARAVDLRANVLDAGTRQIPPDAPPAPAIILPDIPVTRQTPTPGSIWQTRDSREAEQTGRTYR